MTKKLRVIVYCRQNGDSYNSDVLTGVNSAQIAVLWWQLANSTVATQSSMIADKCFIVWNGTTDDDGSQASNDSSTRRLACPYGWNYDRDPIETSIVTDVSINETRCMAMPSLMAARLLGQKSGPIFLRL